MTAFPIRCTGREFPNAPAQWRTSWLDRVPAVWQIMFEDSNTPILDAYQGVWVNLTYSGYSPAGGFNIQTNWGRDPAPDGVFMTLSVFRNATLHQARMEVAISFPLGGGTEQVRFFDDFRDVYDVEDFVLGLYEVPRFSPPPPTFIGDSSIHVRIGRYGDLPPNSCIGA